MTLPDFDPGGCLPPGVHEGTLAEVRTRYGYNPKRRAILEGLSEVLERLAGKGVQTVWIDGSFVTSKLRPGDVDVVFVPPVGEGPSDWGLLSLSRRHDLKKFFNVDLWPFPSPQPDKKRPGRTKTILEYFEEDLDGNKKGVILLGEWLK